MVSKGVSFVLSLLLLLLLLLSLLQIPITGPPVRLLQVAQHFLLIPYHRHSAAATTATAVFAADTNHRASSRLVAGSASLPSHPIPPPWWWYCYYCCLWCLWCLCWCQSGIVGIPKRGGSAGRLGLGQHQLTTMMTTMMIRAYSQASVISGLE